jgi:hypothetical protein
MPDASSDDPAEIMTFREPLVSRSVSCESGIVVQRVGGREEALSNDPPELISVDWGTSSLRAYLADADGRVLAEIAAEKGALSLHEGEHEPYLASLLQDWKTQHPHLPVIASGMVGSRQGWIEAMTGKCGC